MRTAFFELVTPPTKYFTCHKEHVKIMSWVGLPFRMHDLSMFSAIITFFRGTGSWS